MRGAAGHLAHAAGKCTFVPYRVFPFPLALRSTPPGVANRASRRDVDLAQWAKWRSEAQTALQYPPVVLTGQQARAVGVGFAKGVAKSRFTIWACSILPEHIHLVLARHTYKVEQIANLLKGEATKQLKAESLHPLARYGETSGKVPSLWEVKQWNYSMNRRSCTARSTLWFSPGS